MHPVIENFLERPASHKIAFWVFSVVFISFVFWQYFFKGSWEEWEKLQEKVENLNVQIQEQQRIARDLPKFREETAALDKKLAALLRELPDKKEIESLLKSVSVLAVDTGLEVIKFAPQKEIHRGFYAELPVSIELRGTFHQLATFFDEVGHLARVVNIRDVMITIEMEGAREVLIRSKCTAITFRYLDESERTDNKEQPDQSKKRRRGRAASSK
ncbi:MAG: type 4a pilus biogenesis protein PilO [Deltaproteobacteria bacterium]|nr:type 4a pilus biogenesis protein PilO [Deltaproteobacteria bacterium]